MQDGTGEVIGGGIDSGGKSDTGAGVGNSGGTEGGAYKPEILNGFDGGPETERIQYSTPGDARRTKSGRIDGRTLRGKRSAQTSPEESVHLSRISLEDAITTTNVFLAGILSEWLKLSGDQQKILAIDKDENKALADAITEVAKFHALTFDPKKVAYFNLAVAFGSVYGTRAFALWNLGKLEAQAKPQPVSQPRQTGPQSTERTNGKTKFSPSELFGDQGGGL